MAHVPDAHGGDTEVWDEQGQVNLVTCNQMGRGSHTVYTPTQARKVARALNEAAEKAEGTDG